MIGILSRCGERRAIVVGARPGSCLNRLSALRFSILSDSWWESVAAATGSGARAGGCKPPRREATGDLRPTHGSKTALFGTLRQRAAYIRTRAARSDRARFDQILGRLGTLPRAKATG
jgi:hypothetical protein